MNTDVYETGKKIELQWCSHLQALCVPACKTSMGFVVHYSFRRGKKHTKTTTKYAFLSEAATRPIMQHMSSRTQGDTRTNARSVTSMTYGRISTYIAIYILHRTTVACCLGAVRLLSPLSLPRWIQMTLSELQSR